MVPLFERLLDANRALSRGAPDEAAGLARAVLAADAGNAFASLVLGRALLASGQHRAAIAALTAYLERVPGSADAHHWIALAHLRPGDRGRALAEEDAALAIDARHGAAIALRAGLLFSSGREQEGLEALRAAVAANPANPSLRVDLADLLADAGRSAEAEPEYRRALDERPGDPRARLGLGLLLAGSDRPERGAGGVQPPARRRPGPGRSPPGARAWCSNGWDVAPRRGPSTSGCARRRAGPISGRRPRAGCRDDAEQRRRPGPAPPPVRTSRQARDDLAGVVAPQHLVEGRHVLVDGAAQLGRAASAAARRAAWRPPCADRSA